MYSDCPGTIRTTCTPPPQSGLLYPIRTKKARCFQEKVPANRGSEGSGGTPGKRWGTLERVPQTPQNFSRINLLLGRRLCRFQGKCHPKQSPPQDESAPRRFRPGCRGRSPRQSKLKISPFPRGEGGRGDRGQENQLKAVATGDKESTPTSRTPPAEQWQNKTTPQTNLRKTKKDAHAPSIIQTSKLSSHYHKIHLQPKRRKRRGEKETQTNEEPLHRRGARGSSPRSISIG